MMKSSQSALTEYVVLITEIGHLVVVLGRKADVLGPSIVMLG